MIKIKFRLIATVSMLLALSAVALAQTSKGFVVGNIVDPNGAVIVGANVKITNVSTGVSRETVSASDGSFRIDAEASVGCRYGFPANTGAHVCNFDIGTNDHCAVRINYVSNNESFAGLRQSDGAKCQ